ncbi:MAG: KOW domain-containing RNA-binding protein [Bacillota bacterium]|nr:KOW domain-containing RNA-binding protein [Bacillota bacterium]
MNPGDLVLSRAGRDKNRYYIVVNMEKDYCYICDGDMRKSDRPKKKKNLHLVQTGLSSDFIKNRLNEGQRVTNNELRQEISKIKDLLHPSESPTE